MAIRASEGRSGALSIFTDALDELSRIGPMAFSEYTDGDRMFADMTIGLAPVIGIPLPFISYGGSSLWSFTILLFIFIKLDSDRLNIL